MFNSFFNLFRKNESHKLAVQLKNELKEERFNYLKDQIDKLVDELIPFLTEEGEIEWIVEHIRGANRFGDTELKIFIIKPREVNLAVFESLNNAKKYRGEYVFCRMFPKTEEYLKSNGFKIKRDIYPGYKICW